MNILIADDDLIMMCLLPNLALKFFDQLKNMEVWFICKVHIDKSGFLPKIVDLCKKRPFLLDLSGMSYASIGKCFIML